MCISLQGGGPAGDVMYLTCHNFHVGTTFQPRLKSRKDNQLTLKYLLNSLLTEYKLSFTFLIAV